MQVVLLAAQSLDGRITRGGLAGDAFTSEADKAHFRIALRACDACVMGAATYEESKDRLRPDMLPGLRRVVRTRTPQARAAEAVPGVLEFSAETSVEIVARLRADGRRRCALLGGGKTNGDFLRAGLVDEVCVTVEAWIFGSGTPLATPTTADGAEGSSMPDVALILIEARPLAAGGPVLLRYAVKK
jgi:riboflavin biosynthesis pyrimidine reductase